MKLSKQIGNGDLAVFEADRGPTKTERRQLSKRAERNNFLAQSDSKMLPDRGLSESKLNEWKVYRQKLRDLDFSDPSKVVFPMKPK